ncbi:FdhD protein [Desulfocicer vacuolatum DSM 3385]|uniref:Sulfur carrier protein FdhD n=1 Tax=Desulfocicer vacuolatum DSM 3385 TaxID=1121400 RepID=A0A1W2AYZ7_9BACT|nr:formate dehydrogenase accessory sulfurtransferase FdhD [Desulfocicer vacuolatum]SMC65691.1 FdhD protein [Desulfocicer vacuolatum DSM 3385]
MNMKMSNAGINPARTMEVMDHAGEIKEVGVASEYPLTIKVDGREIVTLMTIGTNPEELALGYLRNQKLLENIGDIAEVNVDWTHETAEITTHGHNTPVEIESKLSTRIVTSGCGQGTLFSCSLDKLYEVDLSGVTVLQSHVYSLLKGLARKNEVYRRAGSVHACALCEKDRVLIFIEEVGRHNATDAISGRMWIENITGAGKMLYTTGRVTSEIVIKAAQMDIAVLISKSGITNMALELARDLKMTIIGRAKQSRFLVYHGRENVVLDQLPPKK